MGRGKGAAGGVEGGRGLGAGRGKAGVGEGEAVCLFVYVCFQFVLFMKEQSSAVRSI